MLPAVQTVTTYLYLYLLAVLFVSFAVEAAFEVLPLPRFCVVLCAFLGKNMREDGVNKKTVRIWIICAYLISFLPFLGSFL